MVVSRVAKRALAVCVLAGAVPFASAADGGFTWPHGARAAVSLAYDDALDSQLDNAIPALDRAGLKGSFYLTLGSDTLKRRLADWRAAAARGHELGNHTLFHQCSRNQPGREWVTPEQDLDTTSALRLAAQVRLGNTLLQAIDGRSERTFTSPCGDRLAQGENYLPLIQADFVAIKSGPGGVVADMARLDPYFVGIATPSGVTGQQLIDIVRQAAHAGTMANITFHGIGGDYLTVSAQAHQELLDYLAAHRDEYWTDTFLNVMRHVRAQRAAGAAASARDL